ncbi:MAG: glutamate synthase subunit beta [Candidatus Competibacter denitrificans]|jgi:glutamate synthase (NADPH/NADH) small chain|uniref:Glutamate synthase, beta subunit n=1 Tax=Candidatus Competibacter denitrificans Run_A_D11 TaxID=1400863 RepID=W6MAC1_9GAMM|nr:glutamate synthase subunit beta [Candidatus Competibacter denitrificans]CDI03664.1 Glutamate synthase, beta subunit [Candidatus Competibacter denitrificans Run_A_D11]HAS86763.1 glutamate synthase subunit beta [Candidatus Competibacteraceae bacterium]HRC68344.1 glutamate synthase subunit beta [Candidatus Competibacter denitrificans]
MGKPTGFLEIVRHEHGYAPVAERITHFRDFVAPLPEAGVREQAARCMDCGIPYCHRGCPVHNIIPDWNDLVYRGNWRQALEVLHSTNNFPEFTGRICPAPCETSCTLNFNSQPVTIKDIECAIIDKGWAEGWIQPQIASHRTGKRVAVIGSGPAGLACAQQLARAGHVVVVFEKNPRIGGLLRYGIPDFKLETWLIDRRLAQLRAEGVEFRPNSHVGVEIPARSLLAEFDAVALTGGSEQPRDLTAPGRDLTGIHFAMDFLAQQNRRVAGQKIVDADILATDKDVIVIGGGDTGSDCVGTSIRQGARSVTQLEIMPKPPVHENKLLTWPDWPLKLRTSSSHEEGCERDWSVATKQFIGQDGQVTALQLVRLAWRDDKGRQVMAEVPGSEFELKAGLVLLAMGFVHPVHEGLLRDLGVALDERGNVAASTTDYQTSVNKVFAAGDMRRGQSLVVWAIREGRQCARAVDEYLMGNSELPT